MTNAQLYIAIGIPLFTNAVITGLFWGYMATRFEGVDKRFDAINQRFDDMRELWRTELRRVEEVLDARLKHLEEK